MKTMHLRIDWKSAFVRLFLTTVCVFAIILVCAANTSPLYPYYTNGDSAIFLLIGKGITEGKVCYVDLFDHKGPVHFFLEALGWRIAGRTGVWLLECLMTVLWVLLAQKICKKIKSKSLLPVIAAAFVYLHLFEHGNLTESYSMLPVFLCLYLSVQYYMSQMLNHPPVYAFIYGVCFGLLAFSRVNNALVICTLVLCIIIRLICEKQFCNLLSNLVSGLIGVAVVAVPVCMYFQAKGALYDMLYCTFLHNFFYAKASSSVNVLTDPLKYVVFYAPVIFSVVVFCVKIKKDPAPLWRALLSCAVVCLLSLLFTNSYGHYFVLSVPVYTVAVAAVFPDVPGERRGKTWKKKPWLWGVLAITILHFPYCVYSAGGPFYKGYVTDISYSRYEKVQECIQVIPEAERDSVIGYEIATSWYVDSGITPCYKYYSMQHWWTTEDNDVLGDFVHYVRSMHPKWVIAPKKMEQEDAVKQVLDAEYTLITEGDYGYYRYSGGR